MYEPSKTEIKGKDAECTFVCPCCEKEVKVTVPAKCLERRKAGASVQDAFPGLAASIRELFISGTCPKCFDEMFGG